MQQRPQHKSSILFPLGPPSSHLVEPDIELVGVDHQLQRGEIIYKTGRVTVRTQAGGQGNAQIPEGDWKPLLEPKSFEGGENGRAGSRQSGVGTKRLIQCVESHRSRRPRIISPRNSLQMTLGPAIAELLRTRGRKQLAFPGPFSPGFQPLIS